MTKNELLAVLAAYREAIDVACPGLHPEMAERSQRWPRATEHELEDELAQYLRAASAPSCQVRVFFKLGPQFNYGGCNEQFAADAGRASAAEMVGLNDFHPRIAWVAQAAKYRKDDREVVDRRQAKLGIVERQSSASGVIWLDTSKVPILDGGTAIGIFGTYEVIDAKTASRRNLERNR